MQTARPVDVLDIVLLAVRSWSDVAREERHRKRGPGVADFDSRRALSRPTDKTRAKMTMNYTAPSVETKRAHAEAADARAYADGEKATGDGL